MIMIYPLGIPSLYAVLLWEHRATLADQVSASKARLESPLLGLVCGH